MIEFYLKVFLLLVYFFLRKENNFLQKFYPAICLFNDFHMILNNYQFKYQRLLNLNQKNCSKKQSMSNRKKIFSLSIFILIIQLAIGGLTVTDSNNNDSITLTLNMTIRLKFNFTTSKIFQSCTDTNAIIYAPKYSRFDGLCNSSSQFYECQINNSSIAIKSLKCESYSIEDGQSVQIYVNYIPNKLKKIVSFVAYSTISSSDYEISNKLTLQDYLSCSQGSIEPQCNSTNQCQYGQFSLNIRQSLCLPCSPDCGKCKMLDTYQLQCLTCKNEEYYLSTNSTCKKIIQCSGNQFRAKNMQCEQCSQSCKTCEYINYNCSSCQEGLYLTINYTADSYKINLLCTQIKSSESSLIAFLPFSMSFAILTFVTLFSKFIYKPTMFRNIACSLSGLIESISWIYYACEMVLNFQIDRIILNPTIYLLIGAIFTNTIFNFISIYLFLKYIFGDKTFKNQLISIGEKYSFIPYYITIISSIFFSHKVVELLFSKLYKIPSLSFKISSLNKLTPVTYIRYFSLLPSILAIVAAIFGKISFGNTENLFSILAFDLVALTSTSLISTIWAAQRPDQDYEAKTGNENADLNQNIIDQLYIIKTSKREQQGQIRFSDIKREYLDEPSIRRRQRMQKKTTEGNLILSSQANSQECYYNQIHVNAFEKDEINSLRDTRLTQLNMQKRQSQQDRSSHRSESADFQQFHHTPYNKSTRRIKGLYNRRRTNRSTRSIYSQEECTNLSQKIEENLSCQEIQKLKILQNIQQIWQQIPENMKMSINSLYNNSYRMTRSQILASVTKLANEQLKKLNEHTQFSIRQVQFSLSLLDEVNVTINQFFDYLNNLNRIMNKENNASINGIEVDQNCKNSSKRHRYRANSNESKQNRCKRRYPNANNYSQSPYEIQSSGNQEEEISEFALGQKFSQKHLIKAQTNTSKSIKTGFKSPSRSNQPQPISQVDKELETDKKAAGSMLSLEKKKSNIAMSMDGIQRNLAHKFNSNVSKSTENIRVNVRRPIKTKVAESIIIHESNQNEIIEIEEDQFANGVSVADVIQRYVNTQNDLIQNVPDENEKSYALPPRKSHRRRSNHRYAS